MVTLWRTHAGVVTTVTINNLAKLDAVLKGINLALQRKVKVYLATDSACTHYWIKDTLTGKARMKTKAVCEMLMWRRLRTLQVLIAEYGLTLEIMEIHQHSSHPGVKCMTCFVR